MTGSAGRRQRRNAARRMEAAGVALVARERLPFEYSFTDDDAERLAMLSVGIEHTLVELVRGGADLGSMLAITVGNHPDYPGVTVEAKVARVKPDTSTDHDPGCPIDHSLDEMDG